MPSPAITSLMAEISALSRSHVVGRVKSIQGDLVTIIGLSHAAGLGDMIELTPSNGSPIRAEVLRLTHEEITVLPDGMPEGLSIGDRAVLKGAPTIAPDDSWLGRVIDPFGAALDGRPLFRGPSNRALRAAPPAATRRRGLGSRVETGLTVFNTMLPIVRGQRVGLFAGSGVGKSTLLANLARGLQADVAVIALVGERGREVREFVDRTLGPEGMARSVVIAATSDQSAIVRRRAAWSAMAVAEYFRDQGKQVLFLTDSVTRFAEAHREIALAGGEEPSLRGFPPSTSQMIMSLAERAGPGSGTMGDITAIFSVLVAGSDMDEPVADILRGVLDGHVVLDRQIAERGRFPAIDLLRSVSRSLPDAASGDENALITGARRLLGAYERVEVMIQAGLYTAGSDPEIDAAIKVWPLLDAFLAQEEAEDTAASFANLAQCLAAAEPKNRL
ncbi:FliI/YscN family ATPase [Actibacterium lipolyticum]|uniref:Putative ATP synthase YscN n=1 Tax=Actibacterium lipolyticum TaxID=1524263 RepID=A0A238KXN5_9RHOB|nr:FliI/YscN family ATPase [Actibacterium lipolyticum]SMX47448.1 putative ATP synthase YscN [Actibacterium lipolyticum]